MPKFLIRFREKFILPLKWGYKFHKQTKEFTLRKNSELLFAKKTIEDSLLKAQRLESEKDIIKYQAILDFINWLIIKNDGSTKK